MSDPVPTGLTDRILTTLRAQEHTHLFRTIDGVWRCEGCGIRLRHDDTCTGANLCHECTADLARLKRYPDPYAAIANHPTCPGCSGTGRVACHAQSCGPGCWNCGGFGSTPCSYIGCGASS